MTTPKINKANAPKIVGDAPPRKHTEEQVKGSSINDSAAMVDDELLVLDKSQQKENKKKRKYSCMSLILTMFGSIGAAIYLLAMLVSLP